MQAQTIRPVSGHVALKKRSRGPDAYYAKYRLPDGRQVQRKLGPAWTDKGRPPVGYFTKKTAEAALAAILTDARRGTLAGMTKSGHTFDDAVAEWLRHREHERAIRPSTLAEYTSVSKALLRKWSGRPIESITTAEVEHWQAELIAEGRLSRRTISKYIIVMGGVFVRARKLWGFANPVEDVERIGEPTYDVLEIFSPEEIWALVRAAESEQDAAIFLTAAFTGLRQGELIALRWHDVDFEGETIRVERGYTHGREDAPKSGRVRSVPMVPEVGSALAKLSQRERFTGDDDLVFTSSTGNYLDGSALRRRYKVARDAAQLRPLRFHDLRHSFGSLAVNAMSTTEVREIMGHADLRVTNRYLHRKRRTDDAARLAEAFKVATPEPVRVEPASS